MEQMLTHTINALHTVVDEVHLSAAREFTLNRTAHHCIAALYDIGLYRQAVSGRRLDDAHVTRARKRHMERARDGCR